VGGSFFCDKEQMMPRRIMLDYYYFLDDDDEDSKMKFDVDLNADSDGKAAKFYVEWGTAFDLDDDGEGETWEGDIDLNVFDQLYTEISLLNVKKDIIGKPFDQEKEIKDYFYLILQDGDRWMHYLLNVPDENTRKARGTEKIYNIVKTILDLCQCDIDPFRVQHEEIYRRIHVSFDYEGSSCSIQLFYINETSFKRCNSVYTLNSNGIGGRSSHNTEKILEGDDYNELKEQLLNINVAELMCDYHGKKYTEEGLNLHFDIYDDFGSFCFSAKNVNKNNMKERNLESLCAIAVKMMELSSLKDTEYYHALDGIRI
jgi:hypothetical protein